MPRSEMERAQIAEERIDPDVDHLRGIPGDGYPPLESGPGDGDIVQTLLDEREGLVAAVPGADPIGIAPVVVYEPILVGGEPEEVVLLLHPSRRRAVIGAEPVHQVLFDVVRLASRAIEAGV